MVRVVLTLDGGIEDLDVLRRQGARALSQLKILRLTEEAYHQGGLLTPEDLGRLLQVSSRTIRSDIAELIADGNSVHTRGYDHDIGRSVRTRLGLWICYLSGFTYEEIMRRTHHSAYSVRRYVLTFGRVLLLVSREVSLVSEISRLLNQSHRLTREYLALFEKYKEGEKQMGYRKAAHYLRHCV